MIVCDLCFVDNRVIPAVYDVRLPALGCWANVCQSCYDATGSRLGLGYGQTLQQQTSIAGEPLGLGGRTPPQMKGKKLVDEDSGFGGRTPPQMSGRTPPQMKGKKLLDDCSAIIRAKMSEKK